MAVGGLAHLDQHAVPRHGGTVHRPSHRPSREADPLVAESTGRAGSHADGRTDIQHLGVTESAQSGGSVVRLQIHDLDIGMWT